MSVVIETTLGDITVDLFVDERKVACLNFLKLCKLKYYNFNLFHTVEQGFIAQTGDPSGVGNGGSSVWGVVEGVHKRFFQAEKIPKIYHTTPGLLSLVSAGDDLVGSQFFFTLGENLRSLDDKHCVIGEVVEGFDTLRKINEAIVDEKFRPYQDIRITHTVVLDDPFPDPRGFQVPSRSPSPTPERLQNGRIAADEDVDDTEGKTAAEIEDMLAEREAKARATILEIVGDLPDAEMAPPENVLFVCKLNPVTLEDDLEIIFSRFGRVKSCEVIRDKKTGDSLQYAFVEFEDQKSCEAAYLKMDNVLIDDRRIHVDFSQSVAKVKWRGKGRGVEGPSGRIDFDNLKDNYGSRREHKQMQRNGMGKGGGRAGGRDGSRQQPPDHGRQTSAERRKAREERHREQEHERRREREQRHRQRSRSPDKRRQGPRGERYEDRERPMHGTSRDLVNREHERDERRGGRRRSRSRSTERMQRNNRRSSPVRQMHNRRSRERHVEKSKHQRAASPVERERENSKLVKHKSNKQKKVKRKRRSSTSDDDSASSSAEDDTKTETSSSSSESDSSEDSSSDDKRRKKKHKKQKSKKSKKKSNKKSRKNKKHRK